MSGTPTGIWSAFAGLFASSTTLICCALPALLVALGAGAALSSLISHVPALVWLSEYKDSLFVLAGLMLGAAGWMQWRTSRAPCPVEPSLRDSCLRTRRIARHTWTVSVAIYAVGGLFAYGLPAIA